MHVSINNKIIDQNQIHHINKDNSRRSKYHKRKYNNINVTRLEENNKNNTSTTFSSSINQSIHHNNNNNQNIINLPVDRLNYNNSKPCICPDETLINFNKQQVLTCCKNTINELNNQPNNSNNTSNNSLEIVRNLDSTQFNSMPQSNSLYKNASSNLLNNRCSNTKQQKLNNVFVKRKRNRILNNYWVRNL